ncbi:Schizosaccharomyces specific protein [Schizosaccharomyces osmophilus]|uniref:Schizosaccharomyces specific protein n=1 Tax=Schizosaccharomyces osmophilus TaxID=2545709 RepID=A0AAE9WA00_9SCHI|nr:Schizosaccharomyces specific protein [Schizosaccharomyces osmophilus]WBW72330.1 Schizosaccharomyces specific protein [Schizosaccharomyces osmophilus]
MEFPVKIEENLIDSYFWNNEDSSGLKQQISDVQKHHSYNKSLRKDIHLSRSELDETRKHLKAQENQLQFEYGEYENELDVFQKKMQVFSTEVLESRFSETLKKKQDDLNSLKTKLMNQEVSAVDYASLVLQTMNH